MKIPAVAFADTPKRGQKLFDKRRLRRDLFFELKARCNTPPLGSRDIDAADSSCTAAIDNNSRFLFVHAAYHRQCVPAEQVHTSGLDAINTIGYNSPMKPTIVGILGKPLSGKDTVAKSIESAFPNVSIVSMGDVLREVKATGPSHRFWHTLEESVTVAMNGGISPDEPVFRCFTQLIEEQQKEGKELFVWTGALRTEAQLDMLDAWCKQYGFDERFLHIEVPDDELLHRLEVRRDLKRDDDKEEVLSFRLKEYDRQSAPVIHRLKKEGRLIAVDGSGLKETVGKRAVDALAMRGIDPEIRLPASSRR